MDELEISGKRYISSKRIAQENKYHSDYIGQLIRGGKISGTKVGRAWYVEEQSFAQYLNQEKPVYSAPVENTQAPVIPVHQEPEATFTEIVVPTATEAHTAHEKIMREEILVQELPKVETVEYVVPIKKAKLTYISDSSPLFPEIPRRIKEIQRPALEAQKHIATAEEVTITPRVYKKRSALRTGVAAVSLVALASAVFAFTFLGSLEINSTVLVEQGKPASVVFTQEKTLCFFFNTCQN